MSASGSAMAMTPSGSRSRTRYMPHRHCRHRRITLRFLTSFRSNSSPIKPIMNRTPRAAALLRIFLAVLTAAGLAAPAARAQLKIQITSGVTNPVPIAIVPFAEAPTDGTDVADVVQHDLVGSGRFTALARNRMPATPTHAADVKF